MHSCPRFARKLTCFSSLSSIVFSLRHASLRSYYTRCVAQKFSHVFSPLCRARNVTIAFSSSLLCVCSRVLVSVSSSRLHSRPRPLFSLANTLMVSRSFQYVAKEEGFLLVFHGIMNNTLAWLHHLPDCRLKYTGRIQLILQNINSDSKKKKKEYSS
jgi:hypothetical protein